MQHKDKSPKSQALARLFSGRRPDLPPYTGCACQDCGLLKGRRESFQELADEAFADLLKKHKEPVGLKAALKESVGSRPKEQRGRTS